MRLSTRLTESPACLITDAFGITPALARLYRASGQVVPASKRILELNPHHPLVTGLQQAHKERGGEDPSLAQTAELLYGAALRRRRHTRGPGKVRRTTRRPPDSHRLGHDLEFGLPEQTSRLDNGSVEHPHLRQVRNSVATAVADVYESP